jgi:cobalt/nickel transport system permease protein
MLLHVGAAHLTIVSQPESIWHQLIPKTRVLCALLMVFAIGLTPNGQWLTWAIYAGVVMVILGLSRVALGPLLKRVAVELVFIGTVLLGTLFRQGGEVLWQWGWLSITTEGLVVLGSVTTKAVLSLLVLNFLTMTTSIPALLNALLELRVPPLLVAILASMHRYVTVLIEEFTSMQRAAHSRNLMGNPKHQRLVFGNMIGSLFLRTYDRGERVHQAMLSRGYQGLPLAASGTQANRRLDILALTLTLSSALLGQIIRG